MTFQKFSFKSEHFGMVLEIGRRQRLLELWMAPASQRAGRRVVDA